MNQILGTARPLPSTAAAAKRIAAAKEHVKDVHGGVKAAATAGTALFDGLLTALVVDFSLFRIREDLVGHGDLLELLTGVGVLVRVIFHCQFSRHQGVVRTEVYP